MKSNEPIQPARVSERIDARGKSAVETVSFARRRDKRRRKNELAKASRKKNR